MVHHKVRNSHHPAIARELLDLDQKTTFADVDTQRIRALGRGQLVSAEKIVGDRSLYAPSLDGSGRQSQVVAVNCTWISQLSEGGPITLRSSATYISYAGTTVNRLSMAVK